jgi:hypothetical protein
MSKQVNDSDPLVSFLYELMRDHVVPGIIEEVVRTSEHQPLGGTTFCNSGLALYAQEVATRLRGQRPAKPSPPPPRILREGESD